MQHGDVLPDELGDNESLEAAIVRVHHIERQLYGVKREAMLACHV
jgi:hypothetical protein